MKILKFVILSITTLLEVTMVFGSAFFINSGHIILRRHLL